MPVSIKEVAREAGVSVATVSRVLGKGPVSDALRARVERAIEITGYRPNLSARRLRSRRSQTIGLVVSDIRNSFFTSVSRAVEDAAYEAGWRVILCNTDENPDKEAMYLRLMQEERVTGLIFAPTRDTASRQDLDALGFPVVLIDRAGPATGVDAVLLDNARASAMLVDHLVDAGYRRIGGIFGKTSTTGQERRDGFAAAMALHGLPCETKFILPQAPAAEDSVGVWLDSADRPDAIVASNGQLLLGAFRAARRRGVALPGGVALAGFDNEGWTEVVSPGLTVIEQPVLDIGRTAMSLLVERLADAGISPRKVVFPGRLLIRGSTAGKR
ncbi:LacI family DNA-binding transcriptional regulator [Paludibacterium paludis]|uniref:LacI family transcriptional regulator n=1 Tax=Paludibacterium paludis TaxID=1225769 RepID=A0A918NZM6_9NEIS|nr:LacI family DNA-binding transcriptional regulator [Paludibacterium paludis]GGY08259.1 LacI family transcriptional regulator [Paludibacterium paludis]